MALPEWLDSEEDRAWRGFMQMSELLRAQLARDLQHHSRLSDADYTVLVHLSEQSEGRIRMTDLASRIMWSKSRLSHQIARMEARGLVRKEECSSDARGAFAVITPAGFGEIQRAAPGYLDSVRRNFIDLLDRDELEQLATISGKILSRLTCFGGPDELCRTAQEP